MSSSGTIHFWPSIYLGLAGAEKYVSAELPFEQGGDSGESWDKGETVTRAERVLSFGAGAGAGVIVVGSSTGRLFKIAFGRRIGEDGRWEISVNEFGVRPSRGVFGFFGFGSSSTQAANEGEGVTGIAISNSADGQARNIWVLYAEKLAVWKLGVGEERLLNQAELMAGLQDEILRSSTGDDHDGADGANEQASFRDPNWERKALSLDLELLDIVLVPSGADARSPRTPTSREGSHVEGLEVGEPIPMLLISFWNPGNSSAGFSDWGNTAPTKQRIYATVGCWFQGTNGTLHR